ncbi:hypothetical protein GCM10010401_10400 [Rarobacter faecitabidus]|uniref:Uncharacterized protein n=1 Tax=Rarobacter faecitabidus TaxID=13243 RepID=A0A542ZPD5_RARFA|nr:hypothetical protein [Rarobacter faecitabidus]TQL62218.1 hypothetical protein FB461_1859 [Rarobacter faecitabidus]
MVGAGAILFTAPAQVATSGTVQGTISDGCGHVQAGAEVVASPGYHAKGQKSRTVTADGGEWFFYGTAEQ